MTTRLLMVVPTYNEADNIAWIVGRILDSVPFAHVLVVDDGSPDGTGAIVDALAADDQRVHVLHRTVKEGLGRAYVAGFTWGLERDYDVLGEIDADGSHAPEVIPHLLDALGEADLAIGSRWVPGGSVVNWPLSRQMLSRGGNVYVRLLLGIPVRDATAGFRLFRRATLERIDVSTVQSTGYVFQADLAFRTLQAGLRIKEIPIEFVERVRGDSKMTKSVATESLRRITRWGLRERRDQIGRVLRPGRRARRSPRSYETSDGSQQSESERETFQRSA